jgi:hypothetical protein
VRHLAWSFVISPLRDLRGGLENLDRVLSGVSA